MKTVKPHLPNCSCDHYDELLPKDHQWWIDAPEYGNCFWLYIQHNSRKHTLLEIAELLGVSMSVITSIERRALNKLKIKMRKLLKDKNNADRGILREKE